MTTTFIRHHGLSGPFGALMDEYARAAEDFCRVAESFDPARFDAERPSDNPNTVSARAICLHVIGAAHRYAHYIRKARGVDFVERYEADPAQLHSSRDVRALLTEGIVLTEETVERVPADAPVPGVRDVQGVAADRDAAELAEAELA